MTHTIQYVGVDSGLESKLREAAPILTMHSVSLHAEGIQVEEWNGGPCDLVVAQSGDADGRAAMVEAIGQGIPIIAIDAPQDATQVDFSLSPDCSTATLTRTLKMALTVTA